MQKIKRNENEQKLRNTFFIEIDIIFDKSVFEEFLLFIEDCKSFVGKVSSDIYFIFLFNLLYKNSF